MARHEHQFQFTGNQIAQAATAEAEYHRERETYWRQEFEDAVAVVEKTISARVERQAITGGYAVDVVIDRGDLAAYGRMQRSFSKAEQHARDAEGFESDAKVYSTQGDRTYEMSREDVAHYRLGGEARKANDQ